MFNHVAQYLLLLICLCRTLSTEKQQSQAEIENIVSITG